MPCDPPGEEPDGGDEEPCGGGRDGLLEVRGEGRVAAGPYQRSFDESPSGQDLEPLTASDRLMMSTVYLPMWRSVSRSLSPA